MDSETYVEDRKLDHVRLVCSSAHCTATKLDINGKKHLVHKTICMEPYQFKSSLRQWFMNPEFAESEVMNEEGKCKKCGCNWTMHMATKWETVEMKKTTDKEVEDESVSEEESEEEEPVKLKMTSSGSAQIRIQNYNEPQPPKPMKRSQSHRHPNRLRKLGEPIREEKAKSEEKCVQSFNAQPQLIEVPIKIEEDEPKPKKTSRSKTTGVYPNQLPKREERPKTTEVNAANLPKSELKIELNEVDRLATDNKKPTRSKTTGVDVTNLPKKQDNKERPKTTEVGVEDLPETDKNTAKQAREKSQKEELKVKAKEERRASIKSEKELKVKAKEERRASIRSSEEEEDEPIKPKHRGIKFKTTGVTNQDLIQNEPPPIHKNAIKPQKFKTLEVDPTHLQPNTSNEKEESRTERSPKMEEGEKTPNEGKPKRRSIRFKFFGSDGKSESPKRDSPPKSPSKSPSKSPTKLHKFDKWKTSKPTDSSLKPYTDQKPPESPTKPKNIKKQQKFADEFDEISEVLQSKAEDYAPSTKLLRFSDIIHIVDKEENGEGNDEVEKENFHDDTSTVYTNVDKNSVMELKFDKPPARRESNENNSSFRKMGRAFNRPESQTTEANGKLSNGNVVNGKLTRKEQKSPKTKDRPAPTKNQPRPHRVSTVKFGQNDEPTIASSTITRASVKKPTKVNSKTNLSPAKPSQNGRLSSSHLNNEPTDEDFAEMNRELHCAQDDDDAVSLVDSQMDTRSEKCRRWLIDNSLAAPQRPEKFLQRLKKMVVRTGRRLKSRFGGRSEQAAKMGN